MGTPKELFPPTIARKIELLEFGRKTGKRLDVNDFADVLEETAKTILPLVPWLDKQVFNKTFVKRHDVPEKYRRKRGLFLFRERGVVSVYLQRSGKWFLCFNDTFLSIFNNPCSIFCEINSELFAMVFWEHSKYFLSKGGRLVEKEAPFMKDVFLYHDIVLNFVSQCFESIRKLIEEKEKRINTMKDWMNLGIDFSESLDPLTSTDKEIEVERFCMWKDEIKGPRRSRLTGSYFCPKALDLFWESVKDRKHIGDGWDVEQTDIDTFSPESLQRFLEKIYWNFEEAEKENVLGRGPITDSEIEVLKKVVESLKK